MNDTRNVYLKMKTLKEAREILFKAFSLSGTLSCETLPVPDGTGPDDPAEAGIKEVEYNTSNAQR